MFLNKNRMVITMTRLNPHANNARGFIRVLSAWGLSPATGYYHLLLERVTSMSFSTALRKFRMPQFPSQISIPFLGENVCIFVLFFKHFYEDFDFEYHINRSGSSSVHGHYLSWSHFRSDSAGAPKHFNTFDA